MTVTLMSASAILIAIAPTYEVAGYGGVAVLLVARLLQGLSVGGEYAASATYLTEASAPSNRGSAPDPGPQPPDGLKSWGCAPEPGPQSPDALKSWGSAPDPGPQSPDG